METSPSSVTSVQSSSSARILIVENKPASEERKAVSCYLVFVTFVSAAGSSLQFGYNLAVINAPELIVQEYFRHVSKFQTVLWPIAVSIFAVGGMVGAFIGPHIAKRIGRKNTLLMNNLLVISGGVMLFATKASSSVTLLIIGRVLVGINAGVNTVVVPMYLSEIAPIKLRGAIGTLNQFGIVSGILFGNILGLQQILGSHKGWPYLFGVTVVIGCIQLCALPFCPESPRYLLIIKKDEAQATESLQKLRGVEDVTSELDEMKLEAAKQTTMEHVHMIDLFCNSDYHKPLLISVVMQLSQQLSGIGGILYYSTSLFVGIGMSENHSQAATCGVGVLSILMTIIVIFLVDIKGRRFLMIFGLGSMAILYLVVTIAFYFVEKNHSWAKYVSVVAILLAVAVFQLGPGAIPWFIVAELFTQSSISAAVSIAGPTNWLGNFAVGLLFPVIKNNIHPYTFVPFFILLVFFVSFTYFVVPETKGLTVQEISARLKKEPNEIEEETSSSEPLLDSFT